jgi:hypothetical protein
VKLIWNGDLRDVDYTMPGATAADLIESLRGRFELPESYPRLGLFDEGGQQVPDDGPLPADGQEYILRPAVIH